MFFHAIHCRDHFLIGLLSSSICCRFIPSDGEKPKSDIPDLNISHRREFIIHQCPVCKCEEAIGVRFA